jgi:hypothetical protein
MNYRNLPTLDDANDRDFGIWIIKSVRIIAKIISWGHSKALSIF